MKIAFLGVEEGKQQFFRDNLKDQELSFFSDITDPAIPSDVEILSIFTNQQINSDTIAKFLNLKFVAVRSTGFDNVDLEITKSKNILVCNVPAYGSHTVAEFAFGLILSLTRKIPAAVTQIKEQHLFSYDKLQGIDLFEKTLGVVGTGKIGKNVIKIAQGFGMKVIAFDAFPDNNFASQNNFSYFSLEDLLKTADIITLHVPYNKETHHLINAQNINLIKNTSFLVNTSRGAVIDSACLLEALNRNQFTGVGLDVLEDEAQIKQNNQILTDMDQQILNHPDVLITPHMAFDTVEANQSILQTTVDNILGFIQNNPKNLVS